MEYSEKWHTAHGTAHSAEVAPARRTAKAGGSATKAGRGTVESPLVTPAKAGVQKPMIFLDSRLSTLRSRATAEDGRGNDRKQCISTFYRENTPVGDR